MIASIHLKIKWFIYDGRFDWCDVRMSIYPNDLNQGKPPMTSANSDIGAYPGRLPEFRDGMLKYPELAIAMLERLRDDWEECPRGLKVPVWMKHGDARRFDYDLMLKPERDIHFPRDDVHEKIRFASFDDKYSHLEAYIANINESEYPVPRLNVRFTFALIPTKGLLNTKASNQLQLAKDITPAADAHALTYDHSWCLVMVDPRAIAVLDIDTPDANTLEKAKIYVGQLTYEETNKSAPIYIHDRCHIGAKDCAFGSIIDLLVSDAKLSIQAQIESKRLWKTLAKGAEVKNVDALISLHKDYGISIPDVRFRFYIPGIIPYLYDNGYSFPPDKLFDMNECTSFARNTYLQNNDFQEHVKVAKMNGWPPVGRKPTSIKNAILSAMNKKNTIRQRVYLSTFSLDEVLPHTKTDAQYAFVLKLFESAEIHKNIEKIPRKHRGNVLGDQLGL